MAKQPTNGAPTTRNVRQKENVQTAEATAHNLKKVEKKDATATEEGNRGVFSKDN